MENQPKHLSLEKVLELLDSRGPVSQSIKGYESRPQQLDMAADIVESYNKNQIALIEAGTGTGKSLAYLLPAILWVLKNGERTVISTHTITLQEQLLHKDIPFLLKALKIEMKAALVKGMNNYICLRKLEDAHYEKPHLSPFEAEELDKIDCWAQATQEGSKSELPFLPSHASWDRVGAEGDACSHSQCPHFKNCFFFKARKEASEAQILVVNHHLLCADLVSRSKTDNQTTGGILPPFERLIIDEAHHLEDVATEYFAARVNRWDLMRQLARLSSEKKAADRVGKLIALRQRFLEAFFNEQDTQIMSLMYRLDTDLPAEKQRINQLLHEAFQVIVDFLDILEKSPEDSFEDSEEETPIERKCRLTKDKLEHPFWKESVFPQVKILIECLQKYIQSLVSLEQDFLFLKNDKFNEKTKGLRIDIQAIANRLQGISEILSDFLSSEYCTTAVKWIEKRPMKMLTNVQLVDAELNIAQRLVDHLFKAFPTIVLCSATLATRKQFDFVRKRLGLTEQYLNRLVIERIYESPFNYKEQALLIVPTDMPSPSDPRFIKSASNQIYQAIEASRGHAFILFTSFNMLKACYEELATRLKAGKYPVFVQGQEQRQTLLMSFKNTPRAVLFGADSFWEGVDVVGDALRCVIIVKLPFKVPSEPLTQARTEAITVAGGNPFIEYTVPHAIVKFKQGFGRLIRNRKDQGCIICLDPRLLNKSYGKLFLGSLPLCEHLFIPQALVAEKMIAFYRKSWAINQSLEFK